MYAVARAPGTCGELIQGTWNGTNFLVTCPVNIYTIAKVEVSEQARGVSINAGLDKTALAVEKLLTFLGKEKVGVSVEISSEIPRGKGMASSTADITAACTATAQALGVPVNHADIAGIALEVEPTDGVMFPGITVFDHVRGLTCRQLAGGIPELDILVVDTGGEVDTCKFNSRVDLTLMNKLNEPLTMKALQKLESGMLNANWQMVGDAARESAWVNQKILKKPHLEELSSICYRYGGVGVNVAHSGTVIGMMFPRRESIDWDGIQESIGRFSSLSVIGRYQLISGGAEIRLEGKGRGTWQPYNRFTEETSMQQQKSME